MQEVETFTIPPKPKKPFDRSYIRGSEHYPRIFVRIPYGATPREVVSILRRSTSAIELDMHFHGPVVIELRYE